MKHYCSPDGNTLVIGTITDGQATIKSVQVYSMLFEKFFDIKSYDEELAEKFLLEMHGLDITENIRNREYDDF